MVNFRKINNSFSSLGTASRHATRRPDAGAEGRLLGGEGHPRIGRWGRQGGRGRCGRERRGTAREANGWMNWMFFRAPQTLRGSFSAVSKPIFKQVNTHFSAFFEIYKISIPLHRSDLRNSVKNQQHFCEIEYWIFNRNFTSFHEKCIKMLFLVEI